MFAPQGRVSYQDASCVAKVYFGFRIEAAHREQLNRVLQGLKIPVRHMTIKKYAIAFGSPR